MILSNLLNQLEDRDKLIPYQGLPHLLLIIMLVKVLSKQLHNNMGSRVPSNGIITHVNDTLKDVHWL